MKKKVLEIILISAISVCSFMLGEHKTEKEMVRASSDRYIDTTTDEFFNNYIDMRKVVDFKATEDGLHLYTNDENEYYWER